ncbi:MAG: isoprenylcysteine carboxyl methyltransferase [Deltaproteobacteria bacterium]|jgi:protein-S-isoprenylcysteine O-methyltransferase Ste14|nr:isoprenylcysteine carboxyl methyltransferase [Deltaproteobacteria bacterium]
MNEAAPSGPGAKLWLTLAVRLTLFALIFLLPAGTWRWPEAWGVISLWAGFAIGSTVFLARHDPELLAERAKASPTQEGQKAWDKVVMLGMFAAGIGLYVVPGLDVQRFGWSQPFPAPVEIAAMLLHLPGFALMHWVTRENTFLSRVVKIDEERGHAVITTGPYAVVRHPMYAGIILLVLALPTALGSRFALIPAAALIVLFILRTSLEDRTLQGELQGYPEYAEQTPYRLVPGIW